MALKRLGNWFQLILLIMAGEAVFILPFVLARVFRPTFLTSFNLSNVELGLCFSTYGIVAFFSYLLGGSLADKYPPKYLIGSSLLLTAAGGIVLANHPSFWMLQLLYGYWGFTTIFLLWAAMLKATRLVGGSHRQGLAFGLLDGGRGLVAAGFGSLGIWVFSMMIGSSNEVGTKYSSEAFNYVIYSCTALVTVIGFATLMFMKSARDHHEKLEVLHWSGLWLNFKTVIKFPAVWLLMVIILCSYVGYKVTDVFSLYASEVLEYDSIKSAQVGTYLLYIRPVVGVAIGLLADRTGISNMMIGSFALAIIASVLFSCGIIGTDSDILFLFSILLIATGVYALRTLYFAAMQEGNIPLVMTGTAIGFISLVGYTPDIFMGPVIGYLLDGWPGQTGHEYVFILCGMFMTVGLIASLVFKKMVR